MCDIVSFEIAIFLNRTKTDHQNRTNFSWHIYYIVNTAFAKTNQGSLNNPETKNKGKIGDGNFTSF